MSYNIKQVLIKRDGMTSQEADEEIKWCDFNTSYFEKSTQGITETITEIKPPNGQSYFDKKEEMEKLFNKAMEVEDEHKKPH